MLESIVRLCIAQRLHCAHPIIRHLGMMGGPVGTETGQVIQTVEVTEMVGLMVLFGISTSL